MIKKGILLLAAVLAGGCVGNVKTVEPAQYDLGQLAGTWLGTRVPVAAVDVQAASWLATPTMHFRLAYAEPLRRQSYAESRWAAPPAELLERVLRRRMVFGQPEFSGGGCRLQLVLDELEQRFDDVQASKIVLEVRAMLLQARGGDILSRRAFLIQKPAATANARGGVGAAGEAVQALADELGAWLEHAAREKSALVERCRT